LIVVKLNVRKTKQPRGIKISIHQWTTTVIIKDPTNRNRTKNRNPGQTAEGYDPDHSDDSSSDESDDESKDIPEDESTTNDSSESEETIAVEEEKGEEIEQEEMPDLPYTYQDYVPADDEIIFAKMPLDECYPPVIPHNWTELTDDERRGYRVKVYNYYCLERWSMAWAYGCHILQYERNGDTPLRPDDFLEINTDTVHRMIYYFGKKPDMVRERGIIRPYFHDKGLCDKYRAAMIDLAQDRHMIMLPCFGLITWIGTDDDDFYPTIQPEGYCRMEMDKENDVREVEITPKDLLPLPEKIQETDHACNI
jgi:hypothetical protein